jgi:hypothetical protein
MMMMIAVGGVAQQLRVQLEQPQQQTTAHGMFVLLLFLCHALCYTAIASTMMQHRNQFFPLKPAESVPTGRSRRWPIPTLIT